jgi:hypothetical protein
MGVYDCVYTRGNAGDPQRLQLDARHWCYLARNFEHPFKHLVGAAHQVRSACEVLGQRWAQGISQCERLFSSG